MCVSDFIGLQNRVGRSGIFFFGNIFVLSVCEILDKFWLKIESSELLSKWSDLHHIFLYMILNKKNFESHNKKTESVFEKRVKYFVIVLEWDFSSNI